MSAATPEPTPTPEPEETFVPSLGDFEQKGIATDSGEYKGLDWQVTDAGELIVTGQMEGDGLDNQSIWEEAPWSQYSGDIKAACLSFTGAKSLYGFFKGYAALSDVYFSGLDTSSVTDMEYIFYGCSSLTRVDVSGFDTQNVGYMRFMFAYCENLASVDVSGFDTGNVRNMRSMFLGCSNLTSVDVSDFDTSNVRDMLYMFYGCRSLPSLDLSGFDTSNVTDMRYMFSGCSNLQEILVGDKWEVPAQSSDMFTGCGVSSVTQK